jgi:arsenate reductase
LLEDRGVEFEYRDYRKQPLSEAELRDLLRVLDVPASELLRPRDRAFKRLGLTGREDQETLIAHMAEHPTLLQRPIGVLGERAVVGRPPKRLLELVDS